MDRTDVAYPSSPNQTPTPVTLLPSARPAKARADGTHRAQHVPPHLQSVVDNAPCASFLLDTSGCMLSSNRAGLTLLGYDNAKNVPISTWADEAFISELGGLIEGIVDGSLPGHRGEQRLIHSSGRVVRANAGFSLLHMEEDGYGIILMQATELT